MRTENRRAESSRGVRAAALAAVAAAVVSVLSACEVAVREPVHDVDGAYAGDEYYSGEAPPPPRAEVAVGVAPAPNYVWIGGYWTRHHDNWHWVNGHWAARPHPDARWEAGHWDRDRRGYVRRPGHWHY